jgi:hypothetical protein
MAYESAMGTEVLQIHPAASRLLRMAPMIQEAGAERQARERSRKVATVLVTLALLAGAGGAGYVGYTYWKKRQGE